jgi:hypothetical protein
MEEPAWRARGVAQPRHGRRPDRAHPARNAVLGCAAGSVSTLPGNAGAIRSFRRRGLTEESPFLEKHSGA